MLLEVRIVVTLGEVILGGCIRGASGVLAILFVDLGADGMHVSHL